MFAVSTGKNRIVHCRGSPERIGKADPAVSQFPIVEFAADHSQKVRHGVFKGSTAELLHLSGGRALCRGGEIAAQNRGKLGGG